MLSGEIKYGSDATISDEVNKRLYKAGTEDGNKYLISLIISDMAKARLDFLPYEEGMTGGYKIAVVVNPGIDFHFYRLDADGSWSHKQGNAPAIQDIGYYKDIYGNDQYYNTKLSDPKKDAAALGYTSFLGYYYLKQSER